MFGYGCLMSPRGPLLGNAFALIIGGVLNIFSLALQMHLFASIFHRFFFFSSSSLFKFHRRDITFIFRVLDERVSFYDMRTGPLLLLSMLMP